MICGLLQRHDIESTCGEKLKYDGCVVQKFCVRFNALIGKVWYLLDCEVIEHVTDGTL